MYDNNGSFAEGYAVGRDANNGYNNGFGGDGWWILLLLLLCGGWGNNGWGCNGGGFNGFTGGYDIGRLATTNDVAVGFNNSAVLSSLNDIKLGQAGIQQSLCQGFNGINTAILQSANGTERGFASLSAQLASCCCDTQRSIEAVNYNMAKNTCDIQNTINTSTRDIIDGQRESTNAILGFLTNEKISSLQAENAALTAQLSQNAQTDRLLTAINKTPVAAYQVPNPYACYSYGYGYNNNCGCGCGCGC